MLTSEFDFKLPDELIAQYPAQPRDACKLLVLNRITGAIEHTQFKHIGCYLNPGDLLVANETRVLPARLLGNKLSSNGAAEILLLKRVDNSGNEREQLWEALVRPGRRLKPKATVVFAGVDGFSATIVDWLDDTSRGARLVRLATTGTQTVDSAIHAVGHVPLPPYITDYQGSDELYQTVYAKNETSAAAPTAGLHFTERLLGELKTQGVGFATVELEVGLDTFRTVSEDSIENHHMHTESYSVSARTIEAVGATKAAGKKVVAVGTTSVRSLESAWDVQTQTMVERNRASTNLYITPGYNYNVVDAMITNFHVPRSTLLMMVCAFGGYNNVMAAYAEAIVERYRFFSFGDAMLLI